MTSKKQPKETVGHRIRTLRLEKHLTQDQFAARLGVSRSAVTQWETDRVGQIRDNLHRVANLLGTSIAYLVSGEIEAFEGDELAIIRLYRACAPEDRQILLCTAERLSDGKSLSSSGHGQNIPPQLWPPGQPVGQRQDPS